ncbi:hypothetical protein U2I54_16160 [Bacillus pseudomycoides]|uniref:Uncharacterized protein n=1 Tax=Bacillus bingmayongensis TaxID=1150157 RepID=A0ABU5JYU5_9BACI|nr:hypothetical protein [Bacillus pseudomycoides]
MEFQEYLKMLATVAPAVATFFIGRWTIKKNQLFDIQDKRLYKAYLPLFRIIEPHLYKELSTDQIKSLIDKMLPITDEHYELIDPFVVYRIPKIKEEIENGHFKHESFEALCIDIDSEFENIRKSLKLPTRSLLFKLQWGQVKSSTRQASKEIVKLIGGALYLAFFVLILYILQTAALKIVSLFS